MGALETLLDLQAHDTTLDQLRHRRAALPARAELDGVRARRAELRAARDELAARRDEVASRQAAAEADIAASEKRVGEIDTRMRSGQVSASRDLQAMEHEIATIKERVSRLEDDALAAMEEREPLDAEVADLDGQIGALDGQEARLLESIASDERSIDGDIASERAARDGLVDGLPADLLQTYERLRSRLGGVGAAKLDGNRCSGCHLTLPATELDRLKREPPDAVVHCEQCGRILVRVG